MTQIDKLIEKLRSNPENLSFQDLDRILVFYGYKLKVSRHYVYRREGRPTIVINAHASRPHPKAINDVRRALADLLDED